MILKFSEKRYEKIRAFAEILQAIESPEKCCAAFERRGSGVRIPSAPLSEYAVLQGKSTPKRDVLIAGGVFVQQRRR